jgi:hypothetical protein
VGDGFGNTKKKRKTAGERWQTADEKSRGKILEGVMKKLRGSYEEC